MIQLIEDENQINEYLGIYAKEIYLKTKSDKYGWFVSEKFILPFILYKTYIFTRILFTSHCINRNIETTIEDEKEFLDDVVSFIKENKISDFIYKPQPSALFRTFPSNATTLEWGSYQLDILEDMDEMIKRMSRSQIRYTKKAIKDGVKIEISNNVNEIFDICNSTLKNQNIPLLMDLDELKNQYSNFYPNHIIMFKALYNDEIQGALVIFFDKECAYYEAGGSINRPYKGSLKLMHLTAMKYLNEKHGVSKYDFIGAMPNIKEGSKEAGIQKFKKEFGSTLLEGYHFSVIINPLKYHLFNFLLKLKFKLKGINYEDPIKRHQKLSN